MSTHLLMMYKFWLINTTGNLVVTDDDVVNAIAYSTMSRQELDKHVKHYYMNYGVEQAA